MQFLRVTNLARWYKIRTHGHVARRGFSAQPICTDRLHISAIYEVAIGNVVDDCVPCDIVECIGDADITRVAPYYDSKLQLPVWLGRTARHNNGIERSAHRALYLAEEIWISLRCPLLHNPDACRAACVDVKPLHCRTRLIDKQINNMLSIIGAGAEYLSWLVDGRVEPQLR